MTAVRESDGEEIIVGWSRPMPYQGASRDRSLRGKARIRARRASQKAAG